MALRKWSEAELDFIRSNANLLKDAEIAARLSVITGVPVTGNSVAKVRGRMGIEKRPGHGACEVRLPPTS